MWIKQPSDPQKPVTGTVVMVVNDTDPRSRVHTSTILKQTSNGIILNPQPQDNPNDPLNWPVWRRDIALVSVSIYALLAGGQTPILAPVMNTLAVEFQRPFHQLSYLVGIFMVSMGVGSALLAPVAVKLGKRFVYLTSLLVFIAGLIWAANATSYVSLIGARVMTGIGASPAESLPSTSIAEIYFAHERAYRLGIYTILLLGGKNLSPLASGFTSARLGWHWIFWIAAMICGLILVAMFFFVHETWWERTPIPDQRSLQECHAAVRARYMSTVSEYIYPHDISIEPHNSLVIHPISGGVNSHSMLQVNSTCTNSPENSLRFGRNFSANSNHILGSIDSTMNNSSKSSISCEFSFNNKQKLKVAPLRKPFFHNLTICTGIKTKGPTWKIFLRPFLLYSYIPVLYATLLYSSSVIWLSVIAETISPIFTGAPYNFKGASVGLLYVAMFIGGIFGSFVAGKLSDILTRWMCRRNGGIYEPEFRLLMILPVMLAIAIGLMGFGWSTEAHSKWIVPAIFLGILGFGTSLASTISITYVVDCYRTYALESLVSLNVAKNCLGLAFSIFVPYFFEASGSKISFIVYGSIEIVLCLIAIPIYYYGKILRSWYDNKAWMDFLYV